MKLIASPNGWSCGITSMAMLFDKTVDQMIRLSGHDGSEIIDPEAKEPQCRRGWHPQEFVDIAFRLGYAMLEIQACPRFEDDKLGIPDYDNRLFGYLYGNPGLILGQYSMNVWHMVAWDGINVFDPAGPRQYAFDGKQEEIAVESFFPIFRIKSNGQRNIRKALDWIRSAA